jgi:hypothetical protein
MFSLEQSLSHSKQVVCVQNQKNPHQDFFYNESPYDLHMNAGSKLSENFMTQICGNSCVLLCILILMDIILVLSFPDAYMLHILPAYPVTLACTFGDHPPVLKSHTVSLIKLRGLMFVMSHHTR